MEQKLPQRKPTYLELDAGTKDGLKRIAKYRHSTLTHTIEEAAKMLIHRESNRIKEDYADLQTLNRLVN